jgi:hypothetical protein
MEEPDCPRQLAGFASLKPSAYCTIGRRPLPIGNCGRAFGKRWLAKTTSGCNISRRLGRFVFPRHQKVEFWLAQNKEWCRVCEKQRTAKGKRHE